MRRRVPLLRSPPPIASAVPPASASTPSTDPAFATPAGVPNGVPPDGSLPRLWRVVCAAAGMGGVGCRAAGGRGTWADGGAECSPHKSDSTCGCVCAWAGHADACACGGRVASVSAAPLTPGPLSRAVASEVCSKLRERGRVSPGGELGRPGGMAGPGAVLAWVAGGGGGRGRPDAVLGLAVGNGKGRSRPGTVLGPAAGDGVGPSGYAPLAPAASGASGRW